jgi:hypothetical protein
MASYFELTLLDKVNYVQCRGTKENYQQLLKDMYIACMKAEDAFYGDAEESKFYTESFAGGRDFTQKNKYGSHITFLTMYVDGRVQFNRQEYVRGVIEDVYAYTLSQNRKNKICKALR